jgi:dTDP-4-amino-4,6-dideoxygalactose transaminase
MNIGFIGLGQMGRNMAGRLLARDFALTVWNRSAAAAEDCRRRGATVAAGPAALFACDVVITMLADDAAVDRAALVAGLEARGIGCGVYYPRPAFDYDCYRGDSRVVVDDVPMAVSVAERCLSLPVHQYLTMGELHRVVAAVTEIVSGR